MNELALKAILTDAHAKCCERQNVSSATLIHALHGSQFVPQAIAAAILTFGDRHAPVHKIIQLLAAEKFEEIVKTNIEAGAMIPGWGSEFVKGEPDPIFTELDRYLEANATKTHSVIHEITRIIREAKDVDLYPNAGAYTAAVGLELGYSPGDIHFLLLECRLPAWRKHTQQYERGSFNFPEKKQAPEG